MARPSGSPTPPMENQCLLSFETREFFDDFYLVLLQSTPLTLERLLCIFSAAPAVDVSTFRLPRSFRTRTDLFSFSCSDGSLDLSLGAFSAIGDFDTGVLPITWSFSS